ncbi:complex I NDUFA9 subunit family protein [Novosphingobium kaempferiae]|uniref:complex I NDUFA9 subunit family protein n=1 Tax=Novosphingobium kaempferiae TaxID=2896849 RepID=UPI001E437C83|nr:complex I NDUFA9 subunit family protein [Novosphingobium kaempferiae]
MTTDPISGKIVTILGGSGFVGRHLAQELLARGARLRIASRHPKKAFVIKPLGNLGQVQFAGVDVTKSDSLAAVLAGSDAVVNLVGAFSGNLDALQGKGVGEVAAAARAAGATAFVHVSAIGADASSDVAYARTKAEGEQAVLAAFPEATIVRPSLMFGPDDNLVNMFANLIARMPAMPVFAPQAKLQPVFVDDVAEAIANALSDASAQGKTFELAGPEVVTMLELNERIANAQGRSRAFAELPDAVSGLIASATGWLPGAPITSDQFKLLQAGSVAGGALPGIADLGVTPRPLGLFLDRWMVRFRKHGRFGAKTASA